ncbi:MAG: RNB domain-containing ribonuclease, partial [Deltaproteobacteria bacterium]|nr:RNB domain-containing ribonuclease [Deltaproteobacteria bacterium]
MSQGKIIEYIDQGNFVCTLCLQDKGNRLHLLTPSNREVNLSPKRALLISRSHIDVQRPREELLIKLRQAEEMRVGLMNDVDVKELWELIRDEDESFDLPYLAHLVFGDVVTDNHLSALMRTLFEDRLHFKMKDGRFLPNSEETVDNILKKREEETLREEKLLQGSLWLKELGNGKELEDPPCREEVVALLTQLALFGKEAADYKYGKELLAKAGISDMREARTLLIRLGLWEEDENLELLRSGIDTSFSKMHLEESNRLSGMDMDKKGYEDLRDLPVLTIDGPLTRDFDDALSLEVMDGVLNLGIHIADVAAVVEPSSVLDAEARERASSIYLPRTQIPMFPPDLSHNTLSLVQGRDRPAISLVARFDRAGDLLDYRFTPAIIRVKHRLTYDEVNTSLSTDDMLKEMERLSLQMRQKRMNQGALSLSLPDMHVTFNPDASIALEFHSQDTPSRMIVAECMILYNWLIARFCEENQIPVLFRTQKEPGEIFSLGETGYLHYVFQQRRKLSPLHIDTAAGPHSGLGLDAYTHATSPIRRYADLVSQRQVRSFLVGAGAVYAKA